MNEQLPLNYKNFCTKKVIVAHGVVAVLARVAVTAMEPAYGVRPETLATIAQAVYGISRQSRRTVEGAFGISLENQAEAAFGAIEDWSHSVSL